MEKKIVLPGEEVDRECARSDSCFLENQRAFVSVVSLLQENKVVPLKGRYLPRAGDYVVGVISEERFSGFVVDINSPYEGQLSSRDLHEPFRVGDVIFVKIAFVDEVNSAVLADPRRLYGGEILEIEPVKVPRVIGKNLSMVSMIREYTGTDVFVGKNGRLYLKGSDTASAIEAVLKVCREAHVSGLTDRVKHFLEGKR